MLCKYESPYIKYLPTFLEVTETTKNPIASVTRREGPYYDDLFTNQLKYFAECITERKTPKCDDVNALQDYHSSSICSASSANRKLNGRGKKMNIYLPPAPTRGRSIPTAGSARI
jgi:hypothetical protein